MPEWGNLPIPQKLLKAGVRDMVRISDARMSGTSYGACVLHVSPESFVGGPLALLKEGDVVELDVAARQLNMRVSDEELIARRELLGETLAPDGTVMLVEPMAGAAAEDNFNPLGRVFSAASVLVCTSNSLAGDGPALGTLATDAQLSDVLATAGFTRFRRATETPFNRIFEARL